MSLKGSNYSTTILAHTLNCSDHGKFWKDYRKDLHNIVILSVKLAGGNRKQSIYT
jgi:hypothetical protein